MQLVWHRTELRTHDHPALHHAVERAQASGEAILPLVIIDPAIFERPDLSPRRQAWFLENVRALRESYLKLGADLIVREGEPAQVLADLARELKSTPHAISHAHFIRNYTPYAKDRDARATQALQAAGVEVHSHPGQYTHEPGSVLTNEGGRYNVFGPFRKKWETLEAPETFEAPDKLLNIPKTIERGKIPTVKPGIELPQAGEAAALERLDWFVHNAEADYARTRNEPAREGATSKLSYYFNIGALSPRVAMQRASTDKWKFELTWWDFFADVLDKHPESATEEARADWRGFPWRQDDAFVAAWSAGQTGYPYIDAGMRELQATGFMHNNVRMSVASFFCKQGMVDWRVGEEIFRGLLLCGDRAQNVGNWQWVAGCGISAAAYFRITNPTSQGQRRDAAGDYVRRWIPELQDVPDQFVHCPWEMPSPPKNYAARILDHNQARDRFKNTAKEFLASKKPGEAERAEPEGDIED